ncbi:DUF2478 domain-containing protein, partial [Bradyrhizobium sp. LeoA1S1]
EGRDGIKTMVALDIATGHEISICQPLGSGAISCKLDASGFADAAVVVARATKRRVDLLVINNSPSRSPGRGTNLSIRSSLACHSSPPSGKMPC